MMTTNTGLPHRVHIYSIHCKQCERWAFFRELIMLVITTTGAFYGDMDAHDHIATSERM
jgi:hypothetical protein